MAKDRENILEKARAEGFATPSAGMKVPEGYFASFSENIAAMLPERPELTKPAATKEPRTMWERLRPYVYMAAMFAGIWLMLQMFVSINPGRSLAPVEDNPVLADALSTEDFVFDYVYPDLDERDIVDDMLETEEIDSTFELDDLFGDDTENSDQTYILP